MKENKLFLSHTILYAKGWYQQSDNVAADLVKTINADGYFIPMCDANRVDKQLVAEWLIRHLSNNIEIYKKENQAISIFDFYNTCRKNRIMYPESDESDVVIGYVLNQMSSLSYGLWVVVEPNDKVLPLYTMDSLKW